MLKVVGMVPARLESSRLPKKALIEIEGLPMVIHTCKRAQLAHKLNDVFLVTDNILINKTNIEFLDIVLQNQIARFIFTVFCVITLLNGFNFMDGVNALVSGYILSILIILNSIFVD